ncbi:hypothetical protein OHA79_51220 (plasmid) [Streptomyces sp. NBC_00841]|uniref:hypothetical protein n=1 Tax=Streptomyces sp. NBC_00841 TaxID=2975847 RepID=UPI002DD7A75A|nr:hypothetical protein [Streptomyces sp. NBC_00841]WSA05783.1 hypothetical protein OHA79_51220 [Streptomyces sp. NBC_00841]
MALFVVGLVELRRPATVVGTRVVVDIVAGTSAGGLNGMVLATALARRAPETPRSPA